MRCYWDEEDTWFYFEVDAQGWVQRQVELQGPEATPLVAASLAEWQRAHDAGRPAAYERRFGLTAEPPVPDWRGTPRVPDGERFRADLGCRTETPHRPAQLTSLRQ